MKQGQWVAEWKRVRKDFENVMKKEGVGKVLETVHETELKGAAPGLLKCDKAFIEYSEVETTKEKRDAIKQLSTGHDSYRKSRAGHQKSLHKIVNNKNAAKSYSKVFVKAVAGLGEADDEVDKSIGECILAMLNIVSSRARSERKIENVSKSLSKLVKETTAFIKQSMGDATGQHYSENIDEVGAELYGLLKDLDKMIRSKKEIDHKTKAPPQQMLVDAKRFTRHDTVNCMSEDGEVDIKLMRFILKELITDVTAIEKWRKKAWPN